MEQVLHRLSVSGDNSFFSIGTAGTAWITEEGCDCVDDDAVAWDAVAACDAVAWDVPA